jgi:hypothetical protein
LVGRRLLEIGFRGLYMSVQVPLPGLLLSSVSLIQTLAFSPPGYVIPVHEEQVVQSEA